MTNTSQVVKVGIFMTVCLVLLGWLILRVEDWRLWGPEGTRVDAVFDSIVGLDDKAAVRLAANRLTEPEPRPRGRRAGVDGPMLTVAAGVLIGAAVAVKCAPTA